MIEDYFSQLPFEIQEEDPEEDPEEEEEERITKTSPRIEWKVANTHSKIEITIWAETMQEAKNAALELFKESLKVVRVR